MRKLAVGVVVGFLLASGTAIAASHYLITSTKQIKPSVLKSLRGETGPQGPAGATGPAGPQGLPGAPAPSEPLTITDVSSPTLTLAPGQTTYDVDPSWEASCPNGDVVVGTGEDADGIGTTPLLEAFGTNVGGLIYNPTSSPEDISVSIQAICAPGSFGGESSNRRAVSASGSDYASILRTAQAHYSSTLPR